MDHSAASASARPPPSTHSGAQSGADTSTGIRVVVVDDSAVIRGLVKRWIDETPGLEVAGYGTDGTQAIAAAGAVKPHVMILDIEMPLMDGLEALPAILKASPETKVIMASTLTLRNADISLKALTLGAADYVPKPDSARGIAGSESFRRELLDKVRALGDAARKVRGHGAPAAKVSGGGSGAAAVPPAGAIALRAASTVRPRVLAIGASTGGPQALFDVFKKIGPSLKTVPVLVTQHMPPSFTKILADKLAALSGLNAHEGVDGERLLAGHIYVAPGDYHMRVRKDGPSVAIALDQGPPVHFCRPAVDPMFDSVATVFGAATLGVVLTGMGYDGRDGGRIIADGGGTIFAQDEETSVVWGMPGACAQAGICAGVYPLDKISTAIIDTFAGRAT